MKSVQLRDHVYQALRELQSALGLQTISDVVEIAIRLVRAVMRLTPQWRELLSLPEDLIVEQLRRATSINAPQTQVIYVMPMPYPTPMPQAPPMAHLSQGQQLVQPMPQYQQTPYPIQQDFNSQLRNPPRRQFDQSPY